MTLPDAAAPEAPPLALDSSTRSTRCAILDRPLSLDEVMAAVRHPSAGGLAFFVGTVRDESAGRKVTALEYSAYASMAVKEMEAIAVAIEAELPGVRTSVAHRIGTLLVGDAAVICAASAPHRGEAFRACRLLIDRIKERVPIWKREIGPDGAAWVGWEDARCAPDHDHGAHPHDAHPHDARGHGGDGAAHQAPSEPNE